MTYRLFPRCARWVLATYLIIHFGMLVPYATELFSREGVIKNIELLPSYGKVPNLLFFQDSPGFVLASLIALIALSAALYADRLVRPAAFLVWIGWASLLGRNPFISNPSIPYIGFILLALAATPRGDRSIQSLMHRTLWILLAVGYSVSGLHKLGSPSWVDGSALNELLHNPLSRVSPLTDILRESPQVLLKAATWLALCVEILFAPFALFAKSRPWIWLTAVAMHLGILLVVDFADLTAAMLITHLFVFNPSWLQVRAARAGESVEKSLTPAGPVVFYDGACGLCNRFVQWLLAQDTQQQFSFAALQGEYAAKILPPELSQSLSTVVVRTYEGKLLSRSSAVIYICRVLGDVWALAALGLLIPRFLRDRAYALVARYRHRLFPPPEACQLPSAQERARFL